MVESNQNILQEEDAGGLKRRDARKVLIISPVPSHPNDGGAKIRVYSLANSLINLGCEVHFAHVEMYQGDVQRMREWWGERYHAVAYSSPLGVASKLLINIKSRVHRPHDYGIDDWYDEGIDEPLRQLHLKEKFDIVFVEYVFLSRALKLFDENTLKVLDTHDVMSDRHRLFIAQGRVPRWFSCTRQEEKNALARADIVLAIQRKERAHFESLTQKKVMVLGHVTPVKALSSQVKEKVRILFVGSRNKVNVAAIETFIQKVLPLLNAIAGRYELVVVGSVCECIPDSEQYLKRGRVDDLESEYAAADLIVNPVMFGTGLKIKNIEALGYGRALITTPVGAEGIEDGAGHAFVVAEDPASFAAEVSRLVVDGAALAQLGEKAASYMKLVNGTNLEVLTAILNDMR